MNGPVFMDTAFLLAVIDASDRHHETAAECYRKIVSRKLSVLTTDAVLIEIGNGLSKLKWRQAAHQWITGIEKSRTIFTVVPVDADLLARAVRLYGERADKEWGLTDCISFVVMKERNLSAALTVDRHFEQAGFNICMDIDALP